jgi:hypothetical protein
MPVPGPHAGFGSGLCRLPRSRLQSLLVLVSSHPTPLHAPAALRRSPNPKVLGASWDRTSHCSCAAPPAAASCVAAPVPTSACGPPGLYPPVTVLPTLCRPRLAVPPVVWHASSWRGACQATRAIPYRGVAAVPPASPARTGQPGERCADQPCWCPPDMQARVCAAHAHKVEGHRAQCIRALSEVALLL